MGTSWEPEKVLNWIVLHTQTIANALRPVGNPRGLIFQSVGKKIVVELKTQRDRDPVWEGSPLHVSRHVVILVEFVECMWPS